MLSRIPLVGQIVGSVALALILGLSLALFMADRRADKWERQAVRANAELRRISTERNEQKKVSERNVERVVKGDPEIRTITRVIREAPNPEQCRTPGLTTLREVL